MIRTVPAEVSRAATAETRKLSTLRWPWLLPAICAMVGVVAAAVSAALGSGPQPQQNPATGTATIGLYLALALALAAALVTGALTAGGEYRHASMPLTALFTPDRDLLFGAKLGVTAAYSLLLGLTAELGAILGLVAVDRHELEFGLRLVTVLGGGLLAAVCWGLIGASLGLLLRSALLAIVAPLGWLFVIEPLIWLVAHGADVPGVAVLFPGSATVATIAVDSFPTNRLLAPSPAAAVVLLIWTSIAGAGAWWYLRQRDI
ncbi:ABC transporter permease [Nocardia sp. CDC159]|uniref:ABC transporter permease n=1 Tax=Nocardia pulmonis TaxID=2951408 RepID=A0A9X2IXW1_9NOCA|nr:MULTISPECIES: ABC transporter permease [Nocardia]MCM6775808.1 ABC transporter permease [Nocardia pulmonis]MCM6788216.1 ABC transporter permease [Nocardia sp. CDC159]